MNVARQVVCRIPLIVVTWWALTLTSPAQAARAGASANPNATRLVSYSGQVAAGGEAAVRGITVALYRDETGGAPLWLETQNVTIDPAGKFTILLGSTTSGVPEDLFLSNEPRWLGVQVHGQEEQPRVLLSSVPYAFKAIEAETLAGHAASEFVTMEGLQSAVREAVQGAETPVSGSQGLDGHGSVGMDIPSFGIFDFEDRNQSHVVSVQQDGTGTALVASAPNNTAVLGLANSIRPAHAIAGVEGASSLDNSYGVFGLATSISPSSPGIGTYGQSDSPNGTGVRGYASDPSSTAVGVYGVSASTAGIGVAATANSDSGLTYGLVATAKSPQGTGLLVQNTAGGPLIRAKTTQTLFTLDGAGNLTTAGDISGANLSGTSLNITGAGNGVVFSDGSRQTTASTVTLGSNLFTGTQEAPQFFADSQFLIGNHAAINGQAALMPDNLDTVHSFVSPGIQQTRFRLSRSSPDPNGAQHFMIVPYAYGMAIEYPGVVEAWVQDFSVHMNHQGSDPTASARLWVGDEKDTGGLFATAYDRGGGSNSYTVLASDRFSHQSHGSMKYQLRDAADSFQFQWGPYQSEVTRASLTATGSATDLNLTYGSVQGIVTADSGAGAVSLGSISANPVKVVAGNALVAELFPGGNVSIGNSLDNARLSVGSGGSFTVSDAGAVIAASVSASTVSAASITSGSLTLSGPLSTTDITASGTVTANAISSGPIDASSLAAGTLTTSALTATTATATALTSGSTSTDSLTIGAGTPIVKHLSKLASMSFSAVPANSCQTQTALLSDADDGDTVALGIPNSLGTIDGLSWFGWVSAAGTISVRACNSTTVPTMAPPPASIRIDVWKH